MDPASLCNQALGELGINPVTAIDGSDASPAGQWFFRNYEDIRDRVTEEREWTFAVQRHVLAADAVAPAWGYSTRFLLPPSTLRVLVCQPHVAGTSLDAFAVAMALQEGVDVTRLDWRKEGRYIVAGAIDTVQATPSLDAIQVKTLDQIPDTGVWSPGFGDAVAARLAAQACVPLTKNRALSADLWKLYGAKLKEAAADDGRQGKGRRFSANYLSTRRRSG